MAEKAISEQMASSPLGEHLAAIRADRKLSLRRVEELTNKQVSNPYLNQIETGKILQPSPNILYTLANVYGVSYEKLMELAGYISPAPDAGARHGKLPTLSELNLTDGEELELASFLKYIRERDARRTKGDKGGEGG